MILMMLAGWINRQQQEMIEYLKEENKILREKLGHKRILLNDSQRRRLAILGKKLGRAVLSQVSCAFSPDTIMKWHCKLVAAKYDAHLHLDFQRTRINFLFLGNSIKIISKKWQEYVK